MPEGVNGLGVRKQDVMACYVWIGGDVCVRPVREGMEGECAVSQLFVRGSAVRGRSLSLSHLPGALDPVPYPRTINVHASLKVTQYLTLLPYSLKHNFA